MGRNVLCPAALESSISVSRRRETDGIDTNVSEAGLRSFPPLPRAAAGVPWPGRHPEAGAWTPSARDSARGGGCCLCPPHPWLRCQEK